MSKAKVVLLRPCCICEGSGRFLLRQVRDRGDGVQVPWGGVEVRCPHGVAYWPPNRGGAA